VIGRCSESTTTLATGDAPDPLGFAGRRACPPRQPPQPRSILSDWTRRFSSHTST